MKTQQLLSLTILSIVLFSCSNASEGPAGPPGPEGPEGQPGESAYVFEYSNVDFVSPDYEVILPYPEDFEGISSDVALVYLLWDVTTDNEGNQLEVWRQLPQTIQTSFGDINYNFDFTTVDVRVFIVPEFDPINLEPIDTDDWVVRTVIIPGSYWGGRTTIDYSDYNAVKEALGLPEFESKTIKKRRK